MLNQVMKMLADCLNVVLSVSRQRVQTVSLKVLKNIVSFLVDKSDIVIFWYLFAW